MPVLYSSCKGQKRAFEFTGTGIVGVVVSYFGYWELNPGPLQKELVFLNAEPRNDLILKPSLTESFVNCL